MKLVTFTESGRTRIGVVTGDRIVDLSQAAPDLPTDMIDLLRGGPAAMDRARAAADNGAGHFALADVHLEAPVPRPGKVLAIGLNYADHVAEMGRERPDHQIWFNKQAGAVNPPYDPVHLPKVSDKIDYEGEMAFVIGRRCRHVPRERAHEVIAGFAVLNDVSVRDWQMRSQTMMMGKGFDTHCPLGPYLVTADEVGNPHELDVRTWVNGEKRQDTNTRELIFDCYDQVAHLSTAFTLDPGDVISTGTGSGVGAGFKPPRFLKAGDRVRIEIEKLGVIEHEFVPERGDTVID
jgi:2-keto-4-pentenoate hydratase/2-oxohepta-3-ene-1,7-dioic acid hydratase in catechol pathway